MGSARQELGSRRHRARAIGRGTDASPRGASKARRPGAGGEAGGRLLIYVPIIHGEADLGTLARSLRRLTVRNADRRAWKHSRDVIDQMWAELQRTVASWELPWERVRLYQDGLPVCEREAEIVRTLASAGSQNHQLLVSLMDRGATLMGTESPDLLVEEYRLVQRRLAARDPSAADRGAPEQSRALLVRRDRYIAARINKSLRPGEIGLLFLGMLHSVEQYLAQDITVRYPVGRPPRPAKRSI